jgi:hypothetical protein
LEAERLFPEKGLTGQTAKIMRQDMVKYDIMRIFGGYPYENRRIKD